MDGRMYAVAGGKGGVGKTTTALNLAGAFATGGADVAVVDADLGMTNLGELLGVTPETTVHDVLAGSASVADATVEGPAGVSVLAGSRSFDAFRRADPAELGRVTDELRSTHDVVVVDTGAGLSHASLVPFGLADGTVLVTTADDVAVADTRKTAAMVRRVDGRVLGVVVTRTDYETDVDAAVEAADEPLLGTVPEAPAYAGDEPMVETAPDSAPAQAFERIRAAVAEADCPSAGADGTTDTAASDD